MSENVISLSYQYSLKSSSAANFVKNLGVWFDADFSFSEHVKGNCKAFFLQMGDLHRIRQYLTPELVQIPWLGIIWTVVNLSSEVCHVPISTIRITLLLLSQIIESMLMLHSS